MITATVRYQLPPHIDHAACREHSPSLFYADWVEEIGNTRPKLQAYRARLLAHPQVSRAVEEARPFRPYFPLGAPDRD